MVDITHQSDFYARTAGSQHEQYRSVQAWKSKKAAPTVNSPAEAQIIGNLEKAAQGRVGSFDVELENGMAYAASNKKIDVDAQGKQEEAFQFADVVDIVNPLQHLPVVSMIYREITGDKMHPMAQIIGGAIYGGPVGAVVGTVNAISQVQTGKDIGEQALSFVGIHHDAPTNIDKNNPIEQLNDAAARYSDNRSAEDLPGTALSFVNLSEPNRAYERTKIAEGRTAGSMIVKKQMAGYHQSLNTPLMNQQVKLPSLEPVNLDNLPAKEPVTSLSLSPMPPKQDV
ncbi:MAG TPA: hypothetical protein PLF01_00340 [Alphaproteobacteria bacterium]|nr:hypothetical protein [Alphaproteobacteria bacterium]